MRLFVGFLALLAILYVWIPIVVTETGSLTLGGVALTFIAVAFLIACCMD